jgi:hypothetical protein
MENDLKLDEIVSIRSISTGMSCNETIRVITLILGAKILNKIAGTRLVKVKDPGSETDE